MVFPLEIGIIKIQKKKAKTKNPNSRTKNISAVVQTKLSEEIFYLFYSNLKKKKVTIRNFKVHNKIRVKRYFRLKDIFDQRLISMGRALKDVVNIMHL